MMTDANGARESGLYSMSGFARAEGAVGATQWAVELRSVNHKGLDLRFRLPSAIDGLEAQLRPLLQARLQRGSVQLSVSLNRGEQSGTYRINRSFLDELLTLAAELEAAGAAKPNLDSLLTVRGVIEQATPDDDAQMRDALQTAIIDAVHRCIGELLKTRRAEGRHLEEALRSHVDAIEGLANSAETLAGDRAGRVKDRIQTLVGEALGADSRLDPQRLEQEVAMIMVKADVREEIERLRAHCAAARALLHEAAPVGRRLDFLCQEFNREANTLNAKAADVALGRVGLDLKAVIDQMREQVQNIE